MASRSDQLHSHQFALQRAIGALAMRDPDPVSSPMRRIGGGLFGGLMVAVLAVAAVGVIGALRPGTGSAWRDGHAIIIEKETGARYVYVDQVLHPVLNITSAILILGTNQTVQVASKELVDVPRGTPMGILGAPDPLPGPDQLVDDAWSVCSRRPVAATGAAAPTAAAESVVRVGWRPSAQPLDRSSGVLAADPGGGLYLLWNGRRFALPDPSPVLAALTWDQTSATPVAIPALNAIPAGQEIAPLQTTRSSAHSAVSGLHVGEVFKVSNGDAGGRLYGVALADGVATVTYLQALVLAAAGANDGGNIKELTSADLSAAPKLPALTPTGDDAPPENPPAQVRPAQAGGVCATFAAGSTLPELRSVDSLPPVTGEVKTGPSSSGVTPKADYVAVPPGRGAVVSSVADAGAPAGSFALISDLGLRFAVPSTDVLGKLGYTNVTPVALPAALVTLVPAGPALDPDDATKSVPSAA
jgi:type VII secretion protein EccB